MDKEIDVGSREDVKGVKAWVNDMTKLHYHTMKHSSFVKPCRKDHSHFSTFLAWLAIFGFTGLALAVLG